MSTLQSDDDAEVDSSLEVSHKGTLKAEVLDHTFGWRFSAKVQASESKRQCYFVFLALVVQVGLVLLRSSDLRCTSRALARREACTSDEDDLHGSKTNRSKHCSVLRSRN